MSGTVSEELRAGTAAVLSSDRPEDGVKTEEKAPTTPSTPYGEHKKLNETFNNLKSVEFFDPSKVNGDIHVIGVGAVGGAICENLCRLGVAKLHIWDFDVVSPHNLGNQIFRRKDVDQPKVDAIEDILLDINPNMEIVKHNEPVKTTTRLSGYIFLSIDNIDIRRELCTKWKLNPNIKFIIDGRMGLTTGNVHAADWSIRDERENLLNSMDFTHEEALKYTPVSACGLTLSVVCTPRILSAFIVANWIKFCNTENHNYSRFTEVNGYDGFMESYMVYETKTV